MDSLALPINAPAAAPPPKRTVGLLAGLFFVGASCLAAGAFVWSSARSSAAATVPGYPAAEDAQWNPPPAPRSAYLTQEAVNALIAGSVVEGANPLVYLGIVRFPCTPPPPPFPACPNPHPAPSVPFLRRATGGAAARPPPTP